MYENTLNIFICYPRRDAMLASKTYNVDMKTQALRHYGGDIFTIAIKKGNHCSMISFSVFCVDIPLN